MLITMTCVPGRGLLGVTPLVRAIPERNMSTVIVGEPGGPELRLVHADGRAGDLAGHCFRDRHPLHAAATETAGEIEATGVRPLPDQWPAVGSCLQQSRPA